MRKSPMEQVKRFRYSISFKKKRGHRQVYYHTNQGVESVAIQEAYRAAMEEGWTEQGYVLYGVTHSDPDVLVESPMGPMAVAQYKAWYRRNH